MPQKEMTKNMRHNLQNLIYYVFCPTDDTVLVAFDLNIGRRTIRWLDTVKDRIMTYETILDQNEKHVVFQRVKDEGGGIYTFIPLTLFLFREKVKNRILIPQDFETEKELLEAIRETRKNIW